MMMVSDATTWSITYDCHSDDSRGVIYNRNIFIIQAPVLQSLIGTLGQNRLECLQVQYTFQSSLIFENKSRAYSCVNKTDS
jgi:hypothetical protein